MRFVAKLLEHMWLWLACQPVPWPHTIFDLPGAHVVHQKHSMGHVCVCGKGGWGSGYRARERRVGKWVWGQACTKQQVLVLPGSELGRGCCSLSNGTGVPSLFIGAKGVGLPTCELAHSVDLLHIQVRYYSTHA